MYDMHDDVYYDHDKCEIIVVVDMLNVKSTGFLN